MDKPSNSEVLKRFCLVPAEHARVNNFYHCNPKRVWQGFLNSYFAARLDSGEIEFGKTISNASFRLAGLEVKIGLLLADEEARFAHGQTLSGAVKPSIVIDCVLSIFSVLEGLTMLSFIASLTSEQRREIILKDKRGGDKIAKGIKAVTRENCQSEVKKLKELRGRCIHQDMADTKESVDYAEIFEVTALQRHVALLHKYLFALSRIDSPIPETNLTEFCSVDFSNSKNSEVFWNF